MKKLKKLSIMFMLLTMLVVSAVPAYAKSKKKSKAPKPVLSSKEVEMYTGDKEKITLDNAKKSKVTWSTSNKNVATVKKGIIKAKKKGTATIKAKYKGKTYKCKVTVKEMKKDINISDYLNDDGTLKPGVTYTLQEPTLKTGQPVEMLGRIGSEELNIPKPRNAFLSAVIDDCIQIMVQTPSKLVYTNGQWCLPVRQKKGVNSVGYIDSVTKIATKTNNSQLYYDLLFVSSSDPRIMATPVPPVKNTAVSNNCLYICRVDKEELLPNGTFFTITVSYCGFTVVIPCVIDEDMTKYSATEWGAPSWIKYD